ncbi:MAG: hypothetical protein JWO53_1330, partial [Chlamydiia bacterium]|nr:hypothetical protein [Chlamydiia bacterium]
MRHLLFFLLFFVQQPLFGDVLQDSSLRLSSKAKSMAYTAEKDFEKATNESIQKGILLLESGIQDISFRRLPLDAQVPIFLLLAHGYQIQKEYQKEEKLLRSLIENPRLQPFLVRLNTVLAISLLQQERLKEAEVIFKKLMRINVKALSQEERVDIDALYEKLEKHYERVLAQGEQAFQMKKYQEAITYFTLLKMATVEGFYPKVSSRQIKHEFHALIRYRLGLCHFLLNDTVAAIGVLKEQNVKVATPKSRKILLQSLFLLATAQKNERLYEESLTTFHEYNSQDTPSRLLFFKEAHLMAA